MRKNELKLCIVKNQTKVKTCQKRFMSNLYFHLSFTLLLIFFPSTSFTQKYYSCFLSKSTQTLRKCKQKYVLDNDLKVQFPFLHRIYCYQLSSLNPIFFKSKKHTHAQIH